MSEREWKSSAFVPICKIDPQSIPEQNEDHAMRQAYLMGRADARQDFAELVEAARLAKKYLEDVGDYEAQPETIGNDVWKALSAALAKLDAK